MINTFYILRSLSCPATPSNCNKNFFIQSDNSFGNAFTRSNFDDVVDYFACNKRGITPSKYFLHSFESYENNKVTLEKLLVLILF